MNFEFLNFERLVFDVNIKFLVSRHCYIIIFFGKLKLRYLRLIAFVTIMKNSVILLILVYVILSQLAVTVGSEKGQKRNVS